MTYTEHTPWIAEREATICTWKTDYNRGYISNMTSSLLVDFASMSNRQLADYARMLKACGFTGAQVTDIVTAWRASGSWETVHDRYKVFAAALHALGMKFTLWVWAANFTGHGWVDNDVVYRSADPAVPAWQDPRVHATFDKYYNIYADMAPYTDRVIAHFFDPGELRDMESILYFTKLLADKFRAHNPAVKIGIDTWGAPADYPDRLVKAGMPDLMLMELPFLPTWRESGKRAAFRTGVQALGAELGSWGWYTCDYEIDQLAIMTVNNRVISHVFNQTRAQADHVMPPSYWSELDSYHLLNFFSLYAAGHLLINPDADPDALLYESACYIAGEQNAAKLTAVLELIRDARSGDKWETYWHAEPDYVLMHGSFAHVLARCEDAIVSLEFLIAQPEPCDMQPFPVTRRALYRLMLPHLHQICCFARFRVALDALIDMQKDGADSEALQRAVNDLPLDVPEFNCIIGLWGQPEARAARLLTEQFCAKHGLLPPQMCAPLRHDFKHRLVDLLRVCQRGQKQPYWIDHTFYEAGIALGTTLGNDLLNELVTEGVLMRRADGKMALANYADYRFDFNI